MADRLMEMHGFSEPSLSALSTPSTPASPFSKLGIGIAKLANDIASPTPANCRCPNPRLFLQAVNTWPITTFGTCSLSLDIGLQRLFLPESSSLLTSPVPLLVQTFSPLSIFWSIAVSHVYTTRPPTSLSGVSLPPMLPVNSLSWTLNVRILFDNSWPNTLASPVPNSALLFHHTTLFTTSGPMLSVSSRPCHHAPARLAAAQAELEHMFQIGIVRQSESPWASPLHVVPKNATGDCALADFAGAPFGKSVFSKSDLACAFHQIPIAPEDVSETAVTTPFELFEFLRMPFGHCNASQTLQRVVERVLPGLPFVYAYIDDLLVASSTAEEHMELCCAVGPYSADSRDRPVAASSGPCASQARRSSRKPACEGCPDRRHPLDPFSPVSLMVDASDVAVGAVLKQRFAGRTQPLAFFSMKLSPAETRYSTFGRKILVVFLAMKHFQHFVEDRDFTVFTDHKSLSFAPNSTFDKLNPREIRQLDYISQFTSDIRQIDESHNEAADALSRPSIAHLQLSPGIDLAEMAAEQRRVGSPCDEDQEAIPLPDVAAPTVAKAFLSRLVAIFGAPSTITTDRGVQFEYNLFQSHISFLGCTRIRTTAYHPAANGMVDRFHRQLKASLRAANNRGNWTEHLPLVLLGIRSFLKSDLDCFAAELVFGVTVRLPRQMISPAPRVAVEDPTNLLHRLRQFMRTLSPVPPGPSLSKSYHEEDLAKCSHVYLRCDRVRQPLESPYDGPFRVISRGTENFRIQRGTREEFVSGDRLKAAALDPPLNEPCSPLPLLLLHLLLLDPLSLRPVYFICRHIREPRLQIPPHQPPKL
ncbi:hypothetical protein SprV_0902666500 [Sparganum proliferum]